MDSSLTFLLWCKRWEFSCSKSIPLFGLTIHSCLLRDPQVVCSSFSLAPLPLLMPFPGPSYICLEWMKNHDCVLIRAGHIACLMPQRSLKFHMPQTELLTLSLTPHSKFTQNFSLSKYPHQPHRRLLRHLDEILHLFPSPNQSPFELITSFIYFSNLATFFYFPSTIIIQFTIPSSPGTLYQPPH